MHREYQLARTKLPHAKQKLARKSAEVELHKTKRKKAKKAKMVAINDQMRMEHDSYTAKDEMLRRLAPTFSKSDYTATACSPLE